MKQNLNEKKKSRDRPCAQLTQYIQCIATAFSFGNKVMSKSYVYRRVGFCPSPPQPLNIWVNNKTWVTLQ